MITRLAWTAIVGGISIAFYPASNCKAAACGECYRNGSPGIEVKTGTLWNCAPCNSSSPFAGQLPANDEDNYDPGDVGAPKTTRPGGSR